MIPAQSDTDFLTDQLRRSKHHFDDVVQAYWHEALKEIRDTYGNASEQTIQALADIMARGGKRIRATLAEQAYRMFGGKDQRVIDGAGLALEMIHAYLLIADDVSDQSDTRRGGPTAHRALEAWHRRSDFRGDAIHFGESQAALAAMTGAHMAMSDIAALPVDAGRRVAALQNLNELLTATCHGQINDLYNQAACTQDDEAIEHVLVWKTAYYSFVNPLQLGAILAGAPQKALDALEQYGLAAGCAFQISDDIMGLFGDILVTGKDPADDIREGKRTLLVLRALELASTADVDFLESQLGNRSLSPQDFQRCLAIITSSGALTSVREGLHRSCVQAKEALQHSLPDGKELRFLRSLPDYLQEREA